MIQSKRMNGSPGLTRRRPRPRRRREGPIDRSNRLAEALADRFDADEADDALPRIDDDAELHARSEQGRERVAQRRLRLDGRRAGRGGTGIDRSAAGEVVLVDPTQRAVVPVHEQRVLELLDSLEPAADLRPVLARRGR